MGRDDPEPPRHSHAAVELFLRVGDLFHGYHSHSSFVKELDFIIFARTPDMNLSHNLYEAKCSCVGSTTANLSLLYVWL